MKTVLYFVGYVVNLGEGWPPVPTTVTAVDYVGPDSYKVSLSNGNAYTLSARFIRKDHR